MTGPERYDWDPPVWVQVLLGMALIAACWALWCMVGAS